MSQTDYLELLDWTSKRSRANAARLWSAWHQVFQCLSMSGETWSHLENNFVGLFSLVAGQHVEKNPTCFSGGWVFDIATGHFADLKLNIDHIVGSIRDIYSIAEELQAGSLKCIVQVSRSYQPLASIYAR